MPVERVLPDTGGSTTTSAEGGRDGCKHCTGVRIGEAKHGVETLPQSPCRHQLPTTCQISAATYRICTECKWGLVLQGHRSRIGRSYASASANGHCRFESRRPRWMSKHPTGQAPIKRVVPRRQFGRDPIHDLESYTGEAHDHAGLVPERPDLEVEVRSCPSSVNDFMEWCVSPHASMALLMRITRAASTGSSGSASIFPRGQRTPGRPDSADGAEFDIMAVGRYGRGAVGRSRGGTWESGGDGQPDQSGVPAGRSRVA
jgi:hypothetical protein